MHLSEDEARPGHPERDAPATSAGGAIQPKCDACGSGNLSREFVKTALWLDDRLVVVEDLPALVCDHCAEQFYEDETAMVLDIMRGEGFPRDRAARFMTVPVFAFDAERKAARGKVRNGEK